MRPGVCTRPATPEDLDGLVALCLEARGELHVGSQLCTDDPERLRDQLVLLMAVPGGALLTGLLDGDIRGLLLARIVGPGPFSDVVALDLEAIYVRSSGRRRGLGHALLSAAVALADEAGATEVYASPLPGARGMHRFLARIGFAPAAAHRVMTVGALQRRLAQDPSAVVGPPPTGQLPKRRIEDLIARRRRARAALDEDAAAPAEAARQFRASISMQVSRAVQTRRPSSSSTATS